MSDINTGNTVQLARKLVTRLPDDMAQELRVILQRAEAGEDTTIEIVDLLSPNENIRQWMVEQVSLESGSEKMTRGGYSSLAGNPSSVAASKKWVCTNAGCGESFPVIQEDEDAPLCETHRVVMIRFNTKKG